MEAAMIGAAGVSGPLPLTELPCLTITVERLTWLDESSCKTRGETGDGPERMIALTPDPSAFHGV